MCVGARVCAAAGGTEGNTTEKSIIKRSTSPIFLYSVGSL